MAIVNMPIYRQLFDFLCLVSIAIDRAHQLRNCHAALARDLFQTVPELVFKADARLVACNDNRALRNQRLHGFSPANEAAVGFLRLTNSRGSHKPLVLPEFRKPIRREGSVPSLLIADCGLRSPGY